MPAVRQPRSWSKLRITSGKNFKFITITLENHKGLQTRNTEGPKVCRWLNTFRVRCTLSRHQPPRSCGCPFSQRAHTAYRNSSDIPSWKMSSIGSSAVNTPQHVRSERANQWDQNRERFRRHKAIRSEERKEKAVPSQSRNPRTSPYFHSVNIFPALRGERKQREPPVYVIDRLPLNRR